MWLTIIGAVISGLISRAVGKVWPDKPKEETDKLIKEVSDGLIAYSQSTEGKQLLLEQGKINELEVSSGSLFLSGWRPLAGWACAIVFCWAYGIAPVITYFFVLTGHAAPLLPQFNTVDMMLMLGGLLGMGSLRTYEKIQGVNNNH